jgi:hypothetical protein
MFSEHGVLVCCCCAVFKQGSRTHSRQPVTAVRSLLSHGQFCPDDVMASVGCYSCIVVAVHVVCNHV